jgi:TPR repeat protein
VPSTAPAAPTPTPAKPPEEKAPLVAVAPGSLVPGTTPAAPTSAPAKPKEKLGASTTEISALLARGDNLLGVGDIASARLFYERASDAGDGRAALRLGATYDPDFLDQAHLPHLQGNVALALSWYRRARDLGDSEAERWIKAIETKSGR